MFKSTSIGLMIFSIFFLFSCSKEEMTNSTAIGSGSSSSPSGAIMVPLVIPTALQSTATTNLTNESITLTYELTPGNVSSANFMLAIDENDLWAGAAVEAHFLSDLNLQPNFLLDPDRQPQLIPMINALTNCKNHCGCEKPRCSGDNDDKDCWDNCKTIQRESRRNYLREVVDSILNGLGGGDDDDDF